MTRLNRDEYFLRIAELTAQRGECVRRKVGAVIVDIKGRILSTGYNGVAPGVTPCVNTPCMQDYRSPETIGECKASHAEISALVHLASPESARTMYCTTEPCRECVKAVLLTRIDKVVYREPYHNSGKSLWEQSRLILNWIHLPRRTFCEVHSL